MARNPLSTARPEWDMEPANTVTEPLSMVQWLATQIPLIINNATTGHKLQGSGVDNVFVHTWSYTTNWVYVMLSRVKTKKGLFMRKPLFVSRDLSKYAVPKALLRMLERMRKHTSSYCSDEQYNELFGNN